MSLFNIGLRYLTGCTIVVIIKNSEVYTAYFFKDQAINLRLKATYMPTLLYYNSKNFKTISNYINKLNNSLYSAPNAFPEVFIITPVKSAKSSQNPGSKKSKNTRPMLQIRYILSIQEYNQAYLDIY
jgi:hypothetical protein